MKQQHAPEGAQQLSASAALLEAMPDATVGVDRAGVIRFVNRRAEALFGYERGELVGWLIEMLVPESLRTVHEVQRDGYVAAPKTREMGTDLELRGQRRDGTEFPVDIALSHVDTGDGVLVIAAVRDITDRQKAEQGRRWSERLAAVVEYSGDAIISNTPDGIITSFNPAAERMYGYSSVEMVGKSVILLSTEDRIDEAGAILAKIRAGQSVEDFETIRVRKDGTVFPVSLTVERGRAAWHEARRGRAHAIGGLPAGPRVRRPAGPRSDFGWHRVGPDDVWVDEPSSTPYNTWQQARAQLLALFRWERPGAVMVIR